MSSTIEYVRYNIDEHAVNEFEEAYRRASEPLSASTHCRSFELARCVEEPSRYILRIEWDSLEGHMKGFRQSPEFRDFFRHVQPFVDSIDEMQHYERTAVTGTPGTADEV